MTTLKGQILTLPKMSGSVSSPSTLGGNIGAKTINVGEDGATFIPSVSSDGIISWTNDKDLPNPEPVNIKGTKGDKGDKGDRGQQGVQGIQGERGEQGQKGDKGEKGDKGDPGPAGADGQPGKDGAPGKDGHTPVKGVDYFTEADVKEIAERAAEMVDVPGGGGTCEGAVLSVNGIVPDENGNVEVAGGVTSWNDLTDRPFYEIPPAFDIQWDGDMTGYDTFEVEPDVYYVKVSDEVYTAEQLIDATVCWSDGYVENITAENIYNDLPGMLGVGDYTIIIYSAADFIEAAGLPEGSFSNGIWFYKTPDSYTTSLVACTEIKKLDSKYFDLEGYARTEDLSAVATSGSYNDLTDKPFGVGAVEWKEVYSTTYSIPSSQNGVEFDHSVIAQFMPVVGRKYRIDVVSIMTSMVTKSVTAYCVDSLVSGVHNLTIGTAADPVRYSSSSIMSSGYVNFTAAGFIGWKINFYEEVETITTLDEKYLPESVVLESELAEKGYQTETQVTALINNALGVIENGTY